MVTNKLTHCFYTHVQAGNLTQWVGYPDEIFNDAFLNELYGQVITAQPHVCVMNFLFVFVYLEALLTWLIHRRWMVPDAYATCIVYYSGCQAYYVHT